MKSKWYISNAFNEKAEMIFENWAKMSIQKVRYKQLKKQTTTMKIVDLYFFWEFDPGSGWTLAACLRHASRTEWPLEDGVLARSWKKITT